MDKQRLMAEFTKQAVWNGRDEPFVTLDQVKQILTAHEVDLPCVIFGDGGVVPLPNHIAQWVAENLPEDNDE